MKKNKRTEHKKIDIEFSHVTKKYSKCVNDFQRLISLLFPWKKYGSITVLDDLNFKIYQGEKVAFIGKNGCGKSTTLKIISNITVPTSGKVKVHRKVNVLLEVTAGFNPEFSGLENILTRATLLGMNKKEIKPLIPKIFEYAEINEDFWNQQLKRYSSGMVAKLGFAINLICNPQILIVDEALAVGDIAFKNKVEKSIKELSRKDHITLLFVSHDESIVKDLCDRGIYIKDGKIIKDGPLKEIYRSYNNSFHD